MKRFLIYLIFILRICDSLTGFCYFLRQCLNIFNVNLGIRTIEIIIKAKFFLRNVEKSRYASLKMSYMKQGSAWDGTSSPKHFCPRDSSPRDFCPRDSQGFLSQVPTVPRIRVPWDELGTVERLGTSWDSRPRDCPRDFGIFQKKR